MDKPEIHLHNYQSQAISDDYLQWKKRAPQLYDILHIAQLASYSNTFQWTSNREVSENGTEVVHRAIVGTSTLEDNQLLLLKIKLPLGQPMVNTVETSPYEPAAQFCTKQIEVEHRIPQNSDVFRARCNPAKSSLVAAKCSGANPDLNIYDFAETSSNQLNDPVVRLDGHSAEGFGLDWNRQKQSYLASGSSDGRICIWDVASSKETDSSLPPTLQYQFHNGCEDVNWNKINPHILATAGQDRLVAIWDIREKNKTTPQFQKIAHLGHVYSIDFCPFNETLLLSGGDDGQIALWDLRNLAKRVQTFLGHESSVGKVQWSPINRQLFSSISNDRRVVLWDSSRGGEIDEYGEPAEIVFIHAGHEQAVIDCDWLADSYTAGSVDERGRLAIWRPAGTITEQLQDFV